jgi:two-component system, cell cycle response regulator
MQHEFDFHELKAADRLPSPSGIALAIMRLVSREDASLQEVAKLVQTDPALSGRIIAFANSAAFGARRPVVDIRDAVLLVGLNAVSNFALSLSLVGNHKEGRCLNFDYQAFWSRSLLMAVAIAAIMIRNRTAAPEEAFTLGLLAAIGRLALATAWPERYSQCLSVANEKQLQLKEQELFATDHDALTLMLLKDWGLPPVFLDALNQSRVGINSNLQVTRTIRFAKQLIFADKVTDFCLAGESGRPEKLPELENLAEFYGISAEILPDFINEVLQQWQEWGKLIGVSTEIPDSLPGTDANDEPPLAALDLLVVDDDPMVLVSLSKQLSKAGHQVHTCRDGEAALKHVVEKNVQMVITDWHMKPMDGLALCKALRTTAFGKKLYVIMLTSSESEESLVEAFESGIDDYVIKPVSVRVLQARIRAGQRIISLQQQLVQERQELEHSSNELVVSNRRLQQMANTDLLTGLANRRYAITRLEQEWDAAQRYNRPFSVLMMDLDFFKSINDTLGHDVGDQILIHTATLIRQNIRASDVACRLGGEEFFVIANNTDQASGLTLAERIRSSIEKNQLPGVVLQRNLTISIGVAATVGNRPNWEELMKLADQALYQVKHSTRNAVKLASY